VKSPPFQRICHHILKYYGNGVPLVKGLINDPQREEISTAGR